MATLSESQISAMDSKIADADISASEADALAQSMNHFWVSEDAKFRADENSRLSRKLASELRDRRNRIVASGSDDGYASFMQGGIGSNAGVAAEEKLQDPVNELETVAGDTGHDIANAAKQIAPFGIAIGTGTLLVIGLVAAAFIFAKLD